MVDFSPVEGWTTSTAAGLYGAGVIGMQVKQVARKPLECFVNGQLCLSASEPIFALQSMAPCEAASKPFLCRVL